MLDCYSDYNDLPFIVHIDTEISYVFEVAPDRYDLDSWLNSTLCDSQLLLFRLDAIKSALNSTARIVVAHIARNE